MSRRVINRHMSRVRRVFKWGVRKGLIPGEVHFKLCSVEALRYGEARETAAVPAVAEADVESVLKHLPRHVAAMAKVQLRGSMRPGEACCMKWGDIDFGYATGLWLYRPAHHKTQHHGKDRLILLGPDAQEVLRRFLPERIDPTAYVFSPAQAEQERNAARRASDKSRTPSQLRRSELAAKQERRRPPGEHYDVSAYRRAIRRACEKAFAMPAEFLPCTRDKLEKKRERELKRAAWHREHTWRPNQLRHTGATKTRKHFGLEAAQQVLGHSSKRTTEIYAEPDLALAARVAAEIG
jgi:integrase